MSSTDQVFLLKALEKFQKKPQKRSQVVQEVLLPWLRNNHSKRPNHHPQTVISAEETIKKKKENILTRLFKPLKSATTSKEQPNDNNDTDFVRILLGWWKELIGSVQFQHHTHQTNYFDSIVEILSRVELLRYDYCLGADRTCDTNSTNYRLAAEYERLLNSTLQYVIESANATTAYPGTSIFCAHVLALCFFKVPQLANYLLQSLHPVRPRTISRIRQDLLCDALSGEVQSQLLQGMPNHLHPLIIPTAEKRLRDIIVPPSFEFGEHFLSRWKTSDRAFFILFYQQYHIHLQTYIHAAIPGTRYLSLETKNTILALSPGYVHLAAYITDRITSLIQFDPTLSSGESGTDQPDVGENKAMATAAVVTGSTTATPCNLVPFPNWADQPRCPSPPALLDTTRKGGCNQAVVSESFSSSTAIRSKSSRQMMLQSNNEDYSPSGKPRRLDAATHRYVYCLVSCAMTICDDEIPGTTSTPFRLLYQDMLNVWIRVVSKYISCSSAPSVFCLIDFLESMIGELTKTTVATDAPLSSFDCLDHPFILHVLHITLIRADNTIVHLRVLAFIYSHFQFLTQQRPELLRMLCSRILLHPYIFERFLTHWNSGVRVLYIQLLFGRIRQLWTQASVQWNNKTSSMVTMKECDGRMCRNVWRDDHQARHAINRHWTVNNGSRTDVNDYWRCTLEIHIALEALLTAFYRQHARLQSILLPISNIRERHIIMASLSSKDSSPLQFPSPAATTTWPARYHQRKLSSQAASTLPSLPPTPPPHLDDEDVDTAPPPSKSTKQRQRRLSCKYPNRLSRALSIRSASSSAPNLPRKSKSKYQKQRYSLPPSTHHLASSSLSGAAARHCYYYEVPEMYKSTPSSQSCYCLHHRSARDSYPVDRSDMSTTSEEEGDSAYASGTTTPTFMMDTATSSLCAPDTLSAANAWRYPVSAYIYAARAADEMDQVGALERLPRKISTDWPKAWTTAR